MINKETIAKATEIKLHLKSGSGYLVVESRMTPFNLFDIEDVELVQLLIAEAEQVEYEIDITLKTGDIFEYSIDNGCTYELNGHCELYSKFFLTREEFKKMCQEAKKGLEIVNEYTIAIKLRKVYPDIFLKTGFAAGISIDELE